MKTLLSCEDNEGCTPLHYACRLGIHDSVKNMLGLSGQIGLACKSKDKKSALHFAAQWVQLIPRGTTSHSITGKKYWYDLIVSHFLKLLSSKKRHQCHCWPSHSNLLHVSSESHWFLHSRTQNYVISFAKYLYYWNGNAVTHLSCLINLSFTWSLSSHCGNDLVVTV